MKKAVVWTDASYIQGHKDHKGYGAIVEHEDGSRESFSGKLHGEVIHPEFEAMLRGLGKLDGPHEVLLISDYATNQLRKIKICDVDLESLTESYKELILGIRAMGHQVRFKKILGHCGYTENELCDMMAKSAAWNQPTDPITVALKVTNMSLSTWKMRQNNIDSAIKLAESNFLAIGKEYKRMSEVSIYIIVDRNNNKISGQIKLNGKIISDTECEYKYSADPLRMLISAFNQMRAPHEVKIYSNDEYVNRCIELAHKWKKRGWQTYNGVWITNVELFKDALKASGIHLISHYEY